MFRQELRVPPNYGHVLLEGAVDLRVVPDMTVSRFSVKGFNYVPQAFWIVSVGAGFYCLSDVVIRHGK